MDKNKIKTGCNSLIPIKKVINNSIKMGWIQINMLMIKYCKNTTNNKYNLSHRYHINIMATVILNALVNKFRERLVKIVTNVFVFLFLVYQLVCKIKQKRKCSKQSFFFSKIALIYFFFYIVLLVKHIALGMTINKCKKYFNNNK